MKCLFIFQNEGLFEDDYTFRSFIKSMTKLKGSPSMFHKIAILFDCSICVSFVTGAFSQYNHVPIDTFSHKQQCTHSCLQTCCKAFSAPALLMVPGGQCQMNPPPPPPVSPKITYVGSTLWSRTRQPTNQTCPPPPPPPTEQVLHILGQQDHDHHSSSFIHVAKCNDNKIHLRYFPLCSCGVRNV